MTRTYRYLRTAVLVEALQGGFASALCLGLLLFAEPSGTIALSLAAAGALFILYFGRAAERWLTRIEIDPQGIRTLGPLGVTVPWGELRSVRLNHYTTRTDRAGGWMQLVVRATTGRSIRIDSSLDGFARCADAVRAYARAHGHSLDERTRGNFRGLGLASHD